MKSIHNLGLVGVGLIGTSFVRGLLENNIVSNVLAYDSNPSNLEHALNQGWISDQASLNKLSKVCDFIVIATPTKSIVKVLDEISTDLNAEAMLIDVGSTKNEIITHVSEKLPHLRTQFIPCHPIAGWHINGPSSANPDLFNSKNVILVPFPETDSDRVQYVCQLWEGLGAVVTILNDAREHDKFFSALSHFPHFIASSYMEFLLRNPSFSSNLNLGGTGFRDFSRIAGGSEQVWTDIFLSNRLELLNQILEFEELVSEIKELLNKGDKEGISQWLQRTALLRNSWRGSSK